MEEKKKFNPLAKDWLMGDVGKEEESDDEQDESIEEEKEDENKEDVEFKNILEDEEETEEDSDL